MTGQSGSTPTYPVVRETADLQATQIQHLALLCVYCKTGFRANTALARATPVPATGFSIQRYLFSAGFL